MEEFEYLAPHSLEEVLNILAHPDRKAVVLAGGTSLLPALRARSIRPSHVIDLHNLEDLKRIQDRGEYLEIGALVPLEVIAESALVEQRAPVLVKAIKQFANPLIRKSATLAGNLASVHSPMDLAVPLLALDAHVQLRTAGRKQRDIKMTDFLSPETMLKQGELVTRIQLPAPASIGRPFHSWLSQGRATQDRRWYYAKLAKRKAGAPSIVSLALIIERKQGKVQHTHIALGSVARKPVRAYQAEAALIDAQIDARSVARCLDALDAEIAAHEDIFASASYRASMAQVLMRRALRELSA